MEKGYNNQTLTIRIDAEIDEMLDKLEAKEHLKRSDIVRRAIWYYAKEMLDEPPISTDTSGRNQAKC